MLTSEDVQHMINSHTGLYNPVFTVVLLSGHEISTNSDDCWVRDQFMRIGENTYIPYSAIAMIVFER